MRGPFRLTRRLVVARKGERQPAEVRAKIRASLRRTSAYKRERKREREEREAEAARVYPRDLAHLEASGSISTALLPLFECAADENAELRDAIGGDEASPQRKAILGDVIRVGMVLRAELARYLQAGDTDAGARVGSLANSRRASLAVLGLDRHAHEVTDLRTYLESKAEAAEDGAGRAGTDGSGASVSGGSS